MKLLSSALPYILLQRTSYGEKMWPMRIAHRFPSLYRWAVLITTRLYAETIRSRYEADSYDEYKSMMSVLPVVGTVSKILDIGSGVAGYDVGVLGHYGYTPDIYLLDKTAVDKKIHYFFEEHGSFYNSLDVARKVLMENGIPREKIHTGEATDRNDIPFDDARFDLVISLISWGFHYPVMTYLDQVFERMSPCGVLIIDIRKGQGGEEQLRKKFGCMTVLFDGVKRTRVTFRKS